MGFKDVLKQAKQAMNADAIRQGMDAAKNPPSQAEIDEKLQYLTPEQRAAYDANEALVAAAKQEVVDEEARDRVLDGPAGDFLYGPSTGDVDAAFASGGLRAVLAMSKEGLVQNAKSVYTVGAGGPVERDPAAAARLAADEHAARDAARAPYLAPERWPVSISRIATRGRTQLDEVCAYLSSSGLASRPDLVYGVYRVPDRIRLAKTPHSEDGRVVEWDVVHAGIPDSAAAVPVSAAFFGGREQWVARRRGEASVLDEELGLAYLARASVPAEACLGIARFSSFVKPSDKWWSLNGGGGDETGYHCIPIVEGVVVLHPGGDAEGILAQLANEAPLPLGPEVTSGTHTAVLNWRAIQRVVHPQLHQPPQEPSPFPHLPSTPQEVLRAYLEVVGVRSYDCYSAQVTFDQHVGLTGQTRFGTSDFGPKLPCADGKDRRRLHGARLVVVTYRDRPEYGEGRARWDQYQTEVLQAHLERATGARRLVVVDDLPENRLVRAGARAAGLVERVVDAGNWQPPPPYRYCWPAVD